MNTNENAMLQTCTNDVNKLNLIWEGMAQVCKEIRLEFSAKASQEAIFYLNYHPELTYNDRSFKIHTDAIV